VKPKPQQIKSKVNEEEEVWHVVKGKKQISNQMKQSECENDKSDHESSSSIDKFQIHQTRLICFVHWKML